jgi:hypothetical protein
MSPRGLIASASVKTAPGTWDGRKGTLAQQKTMNVVAAVTIFPYDVAFRIDSDQDGESGSRYIDGRKCAVAQQKTMNAAAAVQIETHNLAPRVDPIRDRKRGSRHVFTGLYRRRKAKFPK